MNKVYGKCNLSLRDAYNAHWDMSTLQDQDLSLYKIIVIGFLSKHNSHDSHNFTSNIIITTH